MEPSFRKVVYAREAGVDWRQLVASQLREIGKSVAPKLADSRTYDMECLRQVVADFPESVADQEAGVQDADEAFKGDLLPPEEGDRRHRHGPGGYGSRRLGCTGTARMYPKPTHVSEHFRKRRVEMGLSLTQLAMIVGYSNLSKGYRKIDEFERTGRCHPGLFAKLSAALGIDERTRTRLAYEDFRTWLHTAANPPAPYLTRSGLRGCIGVPEELTTVEEMERYAANYAREQGAPVCLVLDKRIFVRFGADGSLLGIGEAMPPENPRGKRSC